jgi:N-acetylglucosaminyl-diphospho-decaprenol L-rhamnosyltransferase
MLINLSIVSHGHGEVLRTLLTDLNCYRGIHTLKIFLTLNSPALETISKNEIFKIAHWPLEIFYNGQMQGFSKNHNTAFTMSEPGVWCVVNPDISFNATELDKLVYLLSSNRTGLVFPMQVNRLLNKLDYRRTLVTPFSLLKRYLLRTAEASSSSDWVSGSFMAFRTDVFQEIGGFDEKFFLYCEDVDICLRLQLAGYKMVEADFSVIHDTRRSTLKKWNHLKLHLVSLLKLWCSRVFWVYFWNRRKIKQQ